MKKIQKIVKKIENKKVEKAIPKAATAPAPKVPDFKIKPLGGRVVIKEDKESKEQMTASGIIIPISAQEEKGGKRGIVIVVGTGKIEDGKMIPFNVKAGDKVLFQWGDKVQIDNEEYYVVSESEILAIIK